MFNHINMKSQTAQKYKFIFTRHVPGKFFVVS